MFFNTFKIRSVILHMIEPSFYSVFSICVPPGRLFHAVFMAFVIALRDGVMSYVSVMFDKGEV